MKNLRSGNVRFAMKGISWTRPKSVPNAILLAAVVLALPKNSATDALLLVTEFRPRKTSWKKCTISGG
jgi:hypothetical protein